MNFEPLLSNQIKLPCIPTKVMGRRYGFIFIFSVAQANHFESEWAPLRGFWARNGACLQLIFPLLGMKSGMCVSCAMFQCYQCLASLYTHNAFDTETRYSFLVFPNMAD